MKQDRAADFFDFGAHNGFNRVAYTEEDMFYKCLLIGRMQQLGMDVCYDNIGNICGSLNAGETKKVIALHSHTDSVPNGGQFDGAAGVAASLMAIEKMQETGTIPDATLKVIINACEESSRFSVACLGSKYMHGDITPEKFETLKDNKGITLRKAVEDAVGFMHKFNKQLGNREIGRTDFAARKGETDYALESHIEQYDSLARSGKDVGIVRSIASPYRFKLHIEGEQFHTGSTPMEERKDAVLANANFVVALNQRAREKNSNFRATSVGNDTPRGWVMNTGTAEVINTTDIRMFNPWTPALMDELVDEIIRETEKATGTKIEKESLGASQPTKTSDTVDSAISAAAKEKGLSVEEEFFSGAGHDTQYYDNSGLFFVPNTGGSHNPRETMKKSGLFNAAEVIEGTSQKLSKMNINIPAREIKADGFNKLSMPDK